MVYEDSFEGTSSRWYRIQMAFVPSAELLVENALQAGSHVLLYILLEPWEPELLSSRLGRDRGTIPGLICELGITKVNASLS
jgi:hypothetical protein